MSCRILTLIVCIYPNILLNGADSVWVISRQVVKSQTLEKRVVVHRKVQASQCF